MSSISTSKLKMVLDRISNRDKEKITNVDLAGCGLNEFPRELFALEDSLECLNLGESLSISIN